MCVKNYVSIKTVDECLYVFYSDARQIAGVTECLYVFYSDGRQLAGVTEAHHQQRRILRAVALLARYANHLVPVLLRIPLACFMHCV